MLSISTPKGSAKAAVKYYLDGVERSNYTIQGEGNGGPVLQTSDRLRMMMLPALPFPNWPCKGMIHEVMLIVYRVIALGVLGCTVWAALDDDNSGSTQITAVLLAIPLALRVLMIK
jgi:hypothetical protein